MLPRGSAGPRRAGRGPRPGVREDEAASRDVGTGRRGAEPVLPSIRLSYRRGGAHSRRVPWVLPPLRCGAGEGPGLCFLSLLPIRDGEGQRALERDRERERGRREGRKERRKRKKKTASLPAHGVKDGREGGREVEGER